MPVSNCGEAKCYLFHKHRPVVFRVSVDDSRLVIWLQDAATKNEWQTARLQRGDFETAGSFLENGTLEDYAKLFAKSFRKDNTSGSWSSPDDSIDDRVLMLTVASESRHFTFKLKAVQSDPSQQLNIMARELLQAHAQELMKTLQALKKARKAAVEAPATTSTVVGTGAPTAPPSAAASVDQEPAAADETCAHADITLEGLGHKIELRPSGSSAAAFAEFPKGAKIVFRKAGKYIVSITMGFYASDITVPRGAALFELQDAKGATLAANKRTSGCVSTHVVPLVHFAEVAEGETMVVRAKNHGMIGGSVTIHAM